MPGGQHRYPAQRTPASRRGPAMASARAQVLTPSLCFLSSPSGLCHFARREDSGRLEAEPQPRPAHLWRLWPKAPAGPSWDPEFSTSAPVPRGWGHHAGRPRALSGQEPGPCLPIPFAGGSLAALADEGCGSESWFRRAAAPLACPGGGQSRGSAGCWPGPAVCSPDAASWKWKSRPASLEASPRWSLLAPPPRPWQSPALPFLRTVMGICSQNF